MSPANDIDTLRQQAILSSQAGAPFLFLFGLTWCVAAVATYLLPLEMAPWAYPFAGLTTFG